MKFVYLLGVVALAFAVSVAAECDPDSDGKPVCTSANEGAISPNFWDPTRYWKCQNGEPVVVKCDDQTGFVTSLGKCVPWSTWEWVEPCPEELS